MEGTGLLHLPRTARHAGLSLFEVAGELMETGAGRLLAWLRAKSEAARMAAIRRDLHHMSDHYLRDIGLSRGDIERLFR